MVIFRTSGGKSVGFGHIKRTSFLASLIKNRNDVLFLINNDKVIFDYLISKKFKVEYFDNYKIDLTKVRALIFDLRHYSKKDIELIEKLKQESIPSIQITDLGLSLQQTDYLIDGGISLLNKINYDYKEKLLGPDYVILHSRFRHFNKVKRKYSKRGKQALVSLGGASDYRKLRDLIDIVYRYGFKIKVAAGFYIKKNQKKVLRRIYSGLKFVGKTDSLARALFEADISFISSGITAYESASVGTPSVYIYYNEEQKFIAENLEKHGVGISATSLKELYKKRIIEIIKNMNYEKRMKMGLKGKELIDGLGVYRIIEFFYKISIIN